MAERVGLSRNINLDWLNAAAECQMAGMPKEEAQTRLEALIAQTIQSKDNIRKSRTILLNLWYDNQPWIQNTCTEAMRGVSIMERVPIHWALLLAQYPVFYDLCAIMGNLFDYRDEISLQQIKARIYEKWGARTTLEHSLPKNLKTLRDIGVISPGAGIGMYRTNHFIIEDQKTTFALVDAILQNEAREYMTWEEIIHHPALFPFEFRYVTQADIASCDHFLLERMGDNVVIRIRR